MVQPPKELPLISTLPKPIERPGQTQNNQITLKTELPTISMPQKPQGQIIREIPATQDIIISTIDNSNQGSYTTRPKESDVFSFDEAIRSIHKEITQSSTINQSTTIPEKQKHNQDYYTPKNLGEGYFTQIQQYLRSRDPKDLVDDIIKRDFLTGMKDYHNQKSEGKPFYLHKDDLLEKLERKTNELTQKEQEWHQIKIESEELERKKILIEKDVDQEAMELKELFILVKTDQILNTESEEKEQFILKSGQKVKNLNELRKALSYISDEEFYSYIQEQNHLANWTQHGLKMPEIASRMREMKTKQSLEKFLSRPIN